MEKRQVIIQKETVDYPCKVCGRMVEVAKAKPWIIETDKSIIHSWNYGHQHKKVFEILPNGQQVPLEDTMEYD